LSEEIVKARQDPHNYFKEFENVDPFYEIEEFSFEHPYMTEIKELVIPAKFLATEVEAIHPGKETDANYTYIDTLAGLKAMVEHLDASDEIAVDLEHHGYRSYLGFTCLIQISTRSQDFIVDAIALREHLQRLNSSFADPSKVKVFHGADQDIKWLQRDFGVYVVNLFDTHKAIQFLNRSPFTFVSLLFRYANEVTDKEFQLADWRIRPLTPEMVKYARRDTHFLLFIFDRLRQDIIKEAREHGRDPEADLLHVFETSKEVSLLQYKKPSTFSRQYHTIYGTQSNIWGSGRLDLLQQLWVGINSIGLEEQKGTRRR
jgi:exosome complex exonuclease RRP6